MKYYIINANKAVQEIDLHVLIRTIQKGYLPTDTLVCTDVDNTWIPYSEMNFNLEEGKSLIEAQSSNATDKNDNKITGTHNKESSDTASESKTAIVGIVAAIVIIAVFVFIVIYSACGSSHRSTSPSVDNSFNPVYLVGIISAVAFIIFAWLMFSFRSLLTEIRDLLKAKSDGK